MQAKNPRQFFFSLSIPSQEYLAYYRGEVKQIQVISDDGVTLNFPANVLRPFLAHDGVHGDFVMEIGSDNKFQSLKRIRARM